MPNVAISITGSTTLVSPLTNPNERLVITALHLQLNEGASQTMTLQRVNQAAGVVALSGALTKGLTLNPVGDDGWFQCEPGEGFRIALNNSTPVLGFLHYEVRGFPYSG